MNNPFAALAVPLVSRPGDAIPDPARAGRWNAARTKRNRFEPEPAA